MTPRTTSLAPALLTAALTAGLLACSSTPNADAGTDAAVCAPRETRACTCSDGRAGTQVCAAWGDYAACACGAAADGGDAAADVAPAEDARVDAATDTGVGADADAGLPPDIGARDAEPEDARADVGPADTGPIDSGVHTWCTSFPQGFVAPPVPGAVDMGAAPLEVGQQPNERPRETNILQTAFWISATEVTQAEWDRLMPTNPSRVPCPDCSVEGVSWDQAVDYVNALSASCGLPACFPATPADRRTAALDLGCTGFRLPTEAEWEYSARGGTQTAFWSGEATQEFGVEPALDGVAWYLASSGAAVRAAGILRANAYGLYDVHGNVAEWVADGLRTYGPGNLIDPVSHPMSAYAFVLRGGHAGDAPRDCRAASRRSDATGAARVFAGLRVARRR